MAFSSQVFSCGTASQIVCQPISTRDILLRVVSGAGTVVIGGSIAAGPGPAGLTIALADGIVRVPVAGYGGAANADDALYARCMFPGTGTAQLAVFQPL